MSHVSYLNYGVLYFAYKINSKISEGLNYNSKKTEKAIQGRWRTKTASHGKILSSHDYREEGDQTSFLRHKRYQ